MEHLLRSQVPRREKDPRMARPDARHENKQLLDRRIPECKATDRNVLAVNEDIAAELSPPVLRRLLAIEVVRVVDLQREVVAAIGIQALDSVDALGHLTISL